MKSKAFTLIRTRLRQNLVRVQGFTLIELLVVISIIAILLGISLFGLGNARKSSRDARRKADLELIRSGLEIYRSDCGSYPATLPGPLDALVGDDSTASCLSTNTYIAQMPEDPITVRTYLYALSGQTYELCASLEDESLASVTCGGSGNCGEICNYKVVNP